LPPLRPGQLGRLAQARCHVAQPGNLDLGACGAGGGVAVEDFEDDHGAVHDFAADFLFQVARLRGRDFVVDEDGFYPSRLGVGSSVLGRLEGAGCGFAVDKGADFLALALAQIGRGVEAGALLGEGGSSASEASNSTSFTFGSCTAATTAYMGLGFGSFDMRGWLGWVGRRRIVPVNVYASAFQTISCPPCHRPPMPARPPRT
jgi:hypothetical protein